MTQMCGARRLIVASGIAIAGALSLTGCAQPGVLHPPAASPATDASAPASPSSVERLLKAIDIERTVDATFAQVGQIAEGMATQAGIRPQDRAIFERYMQRVAEVMREEAGWAKLKEPMVQIYIKHYTEAEVQGLIAFYESPLGRSMTAKTPAIMQDSARVSQDMLKRVMPRLAEIAKEMRAPAAR